MATSKTTVSNGAKKKTGHTNGAKKSTNANDSHEEGKEALMKLFEHGLKDLYWVEKTLTKAIPKMIKKATSEELVNALEDHLDATEGQVNKVEKVFELMGKAARGKKCVGMDGIIKEGEELLKETEQPAVDAAIIMAAQKVEHYEISSYNSLITLADTLDLVKESAILQEILQQEMDADKLLSQIAVSNVHEAAIG